MVVVLAALLAACGPGERKPAAPADQAEASATVPGEAEARLACDAIDAFFGFVAKNRRDATPSEMEEMSNRMSTHAGRAAKQSASWERLHQAVSDYNAESLITVGAPDEDERLRRTDAALRSMRSQCEKARA